MTSNAEDNRILSTLKQISSTLSQVVHKIDDQQTQMEKTESKLNDCKPSSSSCPEKTPKAKVPPIVHVNRLMYITAINLKSLLGHVNIWNLIYFFCSLNLEPLIVGW